MTDAQRNRMAALEVMLEGQPPYPEGTVVRRMQDELAALREMAEREDGHDQ